MEQALAPSRTGWSDEEKELLFEEIKSAARTGAPLRLVFDKMGEALGRKPNSVRNYYYMQLRANTPEAPRAAPFAVFDEQEVDMLLRQVLSFKAQGKSVRAAVMELAKGDRTKMLRYQNKYRAILRKKPELLQAVCRQMAHEGVPAADPTQKAEEGSAKRVKEKLSYIDKDALKLYEALEGILDRALKNAPTAMDKLKVERDIGLLTLEDVEHAASDMVLLCKEFVALTPAQRMQEMAEFCDELTHHISQVENACNKA